MLYKSLDYFELFIYFSYILFLKIKNLLFFLLTPFKMIYDFYRIIFFTFKIFKIEKSKKIFVDILEIFFDIAYQEYERNHPLLMNYYLFLYLFPQKKISSRKDLILIFKEIKKKNFEKNLKLLKRGHNISTTLYLYPCKLEEFFFQYRFIKKIGFYNYFVKNKREIYFIQRT